MQHHGRKAPSSPTLRCQIALHGMKHWRSMLDRFRILLGILSSRLMNVVDIGSRWNHWWYTFSIVKEHGWVVSACWLESSWIHWSLITMSYTLPMVTLITVESFASIPESNADESSTQRLEEHGSSRSASDSRRVWMYRLHRIQENQRRDFCFISEVIMQYLKKSIRKQNTYRSRIMVYDSYRDFNKFKVYKIILYSELDEMIMMNVLFTFFLSVQKTWTKSRMEFATLKYY